MYPTREAGGDMSLQPCRQ